MVTEKELLDNTIARACKEVVSTVAALTGKFIADNKIHLTGKDFNALDATGKMLYYLAIETFVELLEPLEEYLKTSDIEIFEFYKAIKHIRDILVKSIEPNEDNNGN